MTQVVFKKKPASKKKQLDKHYIGSGHDRFRPCVFSLFSNANCREKYEKKSKCLKIIQYQTF